MICGKIAPERKNRRQQESNRFIETIFENIDVDYIYDFSNSIPIDLNFS